MPPADGAGHPGLAVEALHGDELGLFPEHHSLRASGYILRLIQA
jgi:hypothetical protein